MSNISAESCAFRREEVAGNFGRTSRRLLDDFHQSSMRAPMGEILTDRRSTWPAQPMDRSVRGLLQARWEETAMHRKMGRYG